VGSKTVSDVVAKIEIPVSAGNRTIVVQSLVSQCTEYSAVFVALIADTNLFLILNYKSSELVSRECTQNVERL
jgi:hypothetical protein